MGATATEAHIERGPWLDPEIAAVATTAPARNLLLEGLDGLRAVTRPTYPMSPAVALEDHRVNDDVFVRVYQTRERGDGGAPAIFSIHGGGMVIGDVDMDDARFDRWCQMFSCVGVSVHYRLPPETPYPGPLDDCAAGYRWVLDHAEELGVDVGRVGMAGSSAGGGLAAGLALRLRDDGGALPAFLLLEAPMIDDRQQTPSSTQDGLLVWTRESNEFGWRAYLGDLYDSPDVPTYAAAARATDLSGLPPTFVSVGGADGFRDEVVDFAQRLMHAGTPTELHVYAGAPHGVAMFAGTAVARRFHDDADRWVATLLEQPTST
jgi:acetyl esterase/lipase